LVAVIPKLLKFGNNSTLLLADPLTDKSVGLNFMMFQSAVNPTCHDGTIGLKALQHDLKTRIWEPFDAV
jgi:hypothetical protein